MAMKSCLGLILALLVLVIVVGSGALVWYLSDTAEFTRQGGAPAAGAPARR